MAYIDNNISFLHYTANFTYWFQEQCFTILNDGKPFEHLETAQMFCNEIYSENSPDMRDYIELKILEKHDYLEDEINNEEFRFV